MGDCQLRPPPKLTRSKGSLSFFNDRLPVPVETKREMVYGLKNNLGMGSACCRIELSPKLTIAHIAARKLSDFVTSESTRFFEVTKIPTFFMEKGPSESESNEVFNKGKKVVKGLKVVNDCAERGVALINDFTDANLTKDEAQLQYLLKNIKKNREELPNLDKSKVIAHMRQF